MRGQSFQERQSHYSLSRKNQVFSRHHLDESKADSFSKKMSASSLKNYVDIDRLIDDIKITPQKSSQISEQIKIITSSLSILREIPSVVDEVRTIELLLDSITKKLASEALSNTRLKHTQSIHKESAAKNSNISPVKQFDDNSRIVYTNFSLKEISLPNQQYSIQKEKLQTPIKRFSYEKDENDEMQKLNSEISALQKMLKAKGVSQDYKKYDNSSIQHSLKFQQSTAKSKAYKQSTIAPKKYSLLEKNQQIVLSKSKAMHDRGKLVRAQNNYR